MVSDQLGVVVRHIQKLAGGTPAEEPPDGQALGRFLRHRDEDAFATLVRRHGPLVLGVCRRLLRDGHLAEDAFQATFLILLRRARSLDRRGSLAGWLYTVAYRVAVRARAGAARRRPTPAPEPAAPDGGAWDDLRPVLDEELAKLPETYRLPVVLCYLQGQSNAEAARRLGWPVGTVKGRLARARELLRQRLTRRGVTLAGGAALIGPSAVPAALARAAAAGRASAPARALAEGVLSTMCATKLKCVGAFLLAAVLATFGLGAVPPAEAQRQSDPAASAAGPAPQKRPAPAPDKDRKPAEGEKELTFTGKVLGADGKALDGARVIALAQTSGQPEELVKLGEAKTGKDGAYRITARAAESSALLLVALAPGHALGWHEPSAEKPEPAEIRLEREEPLHGRLLDVQGNPAAGVAVEVTRLGRRSAGQAHDYALYLTAMYRARLDGAAPKPPPPEASDPPELLRAWQRLRSRTNQLFLDELVLADFEVMRLHVHYKRLRTIASIRYRHVEGLPGPVPGWPGPVTTDAQGRFRIAGVGAKQDLGLLINDPRFALQSVSVPARDKPGEFTRVLAGPRALEGVVTDSHTGKPVAGARVEVGTHSGDYYSPESTDSADALLLDLRGRRQSSTRDRWLDVRRAGDRLPEVAATTDAAGRFRVHLYVADSYGVKVTPPDGAPYLARVERVEWPGGEVVRRQYDVALTRAVAVRGKVVEGGEAVAKARVDFYSKSLKLAPGVRSPPPLETGDDGTFEALLPLGQWHLVVNGAAPAYVPTQVPADRLTDQKLREARGESPDFRALQQLPPASGKGPTVYPDAVEALDLKAGPPREVTFTLRRAPAVRGRVVGPDGEPLRDVRMVSRLTDPRATAVYMNDAAAQSLPEGFEKPPARGWHPVEPTVLPDGTFSIPVHDPKATFPVAFLDRDGRLGVTVELSGKQTGEPVTVRLQACGSAKARVTGPDGKALLGHRPTLMLLLPPHAHTVDKVMRASRGGLESDGALGGALDARHYGAGPKSDAGGRVTLPALIPGATYRLLLTHGRHRDFTVRPGEALDLGALALPRPHEAPRLPEVKQ